MAIALVDTATDSYAGTTTHAMPAINSTGASLLVLVVGGGPPTSISDTVNGTATGNTWVAGTTYTTSAVPVTCYWCVNPVVGTNHVVTLTGGTYMSAQGQLSAWSGVDTTAPHDKENGTSSGTGASPLSTGSVTPSTAGQLVIAGLCIPTSYGDGSIDSGFTILGQEGTTGSYGVAAAYLIQTSAAAVNPAWSWAYTANTGFAACIETFKAASGGGGTNYTLTAGSGSYSLSGKSAGLFKGYKLNAAAGSFSLSGQAASFLRTLRLTAATGIFSLVGRAASLIYSGKKLRFSQLSTPDFTVGAMNRTPFADRAPGIRLFGALGPIVAVSPGVYELTDIGTPAAALVSDGQGNYDITDASPSGTGRLVVHTSGIGDIF